jgi:hypothetical protein
VLKTAAITLACVVGLTALMFGIFALFIPKPLAETFDKLGWYSSSMRFYERQYNRSNDVEDLYAICLKVDHETDSVRAEKYLSILVKTDGFRAFCVSKDSKNTAFTTEEYLEAKYVNAVYRNKGIDKALEEAKKCVTYVGTNGYTAYNPYYMLVTDSAFDWDNQSQSRFDELRKIYDAIDFLIWGEYEIEEGVYEWASCIGSQKEMEYATRDLELVASLGSI